MYSQFKNVVLFPPVSPAITNPHADQQCPYSYQQCPFRKIVELVSCTYDQIRDVVNATDH